MTGLTTYPVSTEVNSVRKNGPQLIEPTGRGPMALLGTVAATARAGAGDRGADGTGVLF